MNILTETRERKRERERERECVCVCERECVCQRERERENRCIKSVVKLNVDSSTALNQPATVAGVPGRQSLEFQYVGPIKHLIATVTTLSIICNIVSIRRDR